MNRILFLIFSVIVLAMGVAGSLSRADEVVIRHDEGRHEGDRHRDDRDEHREERRRHDWDRFHRHPVYAPAPVIYAPPPSPGIRIVLPIEIR